MTAIYQKDPDTAQQPASTTKLLTAIVAMESISWALDTIVPVTSDDVVPWGSQSHAGLLVGDEISYRDLLYGMMLPSGNDAANCIARNVGAELSGAGSPMQRFLAEMNAKAADLGMSSSAFYTPSGMGDGQRMSARDLATLMRAYSDDPYLVEVAGTMSRILTITGQNARTYGVSHTIDPDGEIKFPEYICGKTGSYFSGAGSEYDSGSCVAILWEKSPGVRRVTIVMGAATGIDRYRDARRLMDFELARP